jgi:hypothetical protein
VEVNADARRRAEPPATHTSLLGGSMAIYWGKHALPVDKIPGC